MLWIVQKNLFSDNLRGDLLESPRRIGARTLEAEIYGGALHCEPFDEEAPILCNGSVALSKLSERRGWAPGSFFEEARFTHEAWAPHYRDLLLNRDARETTLGEAEIFGDEAFVRPLRDDKSFSGNVFSREELLALR